VFCRQTRELNTYAIPSDVGITIQRRARAAQLIIVKIKLTYISTESWGVPWTSQLLQETLEGMLPKMISKSKLGYISNYASSRCGKRKEGKEEIDDLFYNAAHQKVGNTYA
jgi:hypothetical protein